MDYVIVGNCAACVSAIEGIRSQDEKGRIVVIGDEDVPAYCRCLITHYLAGTHTEEQLALREKDFYKKMCVELLLGEKVADVKPKERKIVLSKGKQMSYGKLLIAAGSTPKSLGVEGDDKKGIFGFRTLSDAKEIARIASGGGRVVVFGGGLIGLKAGYALKVRGMEVEVIVKSGRVLSQITEPDSAGLMSGWLEENGIRIRTGLGPVKVLGDKSLEGFMLDNGEKLECKIAIVGKGVQANTELLKTSGIETHWGVVTDKYLQSGIEDIYAAGDVAETHDLLTGEPALNALWTCATEQGRVAGINMAGGKKEYPGSIAANSVDFFGLPMISIGHVRARGEGLEEKLIYDRKKRVYKKAVIKANNLMGVVLVGRIENAGVYLALIRRKADISSVKDILLEDWFDYGKVSQLLEAGEGFRESVSLQGELVKMA